MKGKGEKKKDINSIMNNINCKKINNTNCKKRKGEILLKYVREVNGPAQNLMEFNGSSMKDDDDIY